MSSTTAVRAPAFLEPGNSTAAPLNVQYRLGKLERLGFLEGVWLDCGCASGGYTEALIEHGVEHAVGIDVDPARIAEAKTRQKHTERTTYRSYDGTKIPAPDSWFDGVLLNEVLEHVADEYATLREILRVLKPGGRLVVMSPNRWFPFEGHGMRAFGRDFGFPVPLLPWVPSRLGMKVMTARNYWPYELRNIVAQAGFEIVTVDYILPVLEMYPWLPASLTRWYQRNLNRLDRSPLRKFGVSTMIVGRRRILKTTM